MEKIDKAIEVLQAYKEGKTIEINWQYNGWLKCLAIHDLFYALNENLEIRIVQEPTYRPYANAEEFLKASKEHGPYLISKTDKDSLYIPTHTYKSAGNDFYIEVWGSERKLMRANVLLTYYVWSDNTQCGILEQ